MLNANGLDDSDDEWQDMPIEHVGPWSPSSANINSDSDSESDNERSPKSKRVAREAKLMRQRRAHMRGRGTSAQVGTSNTAGRHLDVHDVRGYDWRTRPDEQVADPQALGSEGVGYTKLRLDDADEDAELEAATDYLFQEDLNRLDDADDPSAAPISQLALTKRLLSDVQKLAYVGLCSTLCSQIVKELEQLGAKDDRPAIQSAKEWGLRVMIRLYQHLDVEPAEQSMIESLSLHGILPSDLAPSLIATQTIPNPAYDPALAKQEASQPKPPALPQTPKMKQAATSTPETAESPSILTDPNTAAQVIEHASALSGEATRVPEASLKAPHTSSHAHASVTTLDGVTTEVNAANKTITLDLRWTVLCDLFLVLTADSVYDARSRVLLERLAELIGLSWMDVTKFEKRITDSLEIEEDVQTLDDKSITQHHDSASRHKRLMMMGLATVGGGLVIGLSAGLLAPVIGAGIGAALGAVGISGTSAFFSGVGGAAIITTTGTISGAAMGGKGMRRRVKSVQIFEFRPLHYHKRVNCIITVPGFLKGAEDDPTLPYSVIDPIMGDVFSIMWEPQMMQEMGNAMSILWNETLVQGVQQVLAATVAGAMFSALAWPLWLTKLNYLIDNPWSNATERARAAGLILADVLIHRQMGVRPITLVGYSLGARMIFYALLELARKKAFGIVQNVFLMGAPVPSRENEWKTARTVVSGRFVNAFARSDWILAYLHRATSGGVRNIAGLYPVEFGCGIENIDVTNIVPGHLAYRALTPLLLGELGFQTTADYFDEPESLDHVPERTVEKESPQKQHSTATQSLKNFIWGKKEKSPDTVPPPPQLVYDAMEDEVKKPQTSSLESMPVVPTDVVHAPRSDAPQDIPKPIPDDGAELGESSPPMEHQSDDKNSRSPSNEHVAGSDAKEEEAPASKDHEKIPDQQSQHEEPHDVGHQETLRALEAHDHDRHEHHLSDEESEHVASNIPVPEEEPPAYASYGLAADEAAQLAAQFNSGLKPTSPIHVPNEEWETSPDHVLLTSPKRSSDLPAWAAENPWDA